MLDRWHIRAGVWQRSLMRVLEVLLVRAVVVLRSVHASARGQARPASSSLTSQDRSQSLHLGAAAPEGERK